MTSMRISMAGLAMLAVLAAPLAAEEVGEFSIPSVLPLSAAERERLHARVEQDDEAAALAERAEAEAAPLLDDEPRPLEVIHYEGLVNTNPKRIATVEKLRDMAKVARILRYWQVSGDDAAAGALRRFTPAWTSAYKLTGNDVNENKFFPMLVAYHALRDTFEPEQRERVDAWVRGLGELHRAAVAESERFTNRYGKSVRLLAIAGMILDEPEWIDEAREGVKRFVTESLYADGTSRDLRRRDTLTYHGSSLKKPIDLAVMLGPDGLDLYDWTSPEGGSLAKSVEYVVPYAMGEKTHREWVHSKVELDHRRHEAGLEKYRKGRLYEPANALELMEKAACFDPELMRVVLHLTDSGAERFPTWRTLMNAVKRPADDEAPSPDEAPDDACAE